MYNEYVKDNPYRNDLYIFKYISKCHGLLNRVLTRHYQIYLGS